MVFLFFAAILVVDGYLTARDWEEDEWHTGYSEGEAMEVGIAKQFCGICVLLIGLLIIMLGMRWTNEGEQGSS